MHERQVRGANEGWNELLRQISFSCNEYVEKIKEAARSVPLAAGFVEDAEGLIPAEFSIVSAVFVKGRETVKLVWHGGERIGYTKIHDRGEWIELPVIVTSFGEGSLKNALTKLCDSLQAALAPGGNLRSA